jgi:formaldehyde-activating enzyme involved in methanogenesis
MWVSTVLCDLVSVDGIRETEIAAGDLGAAVAVAVAESTDMDVFDKGVKEIDQCFVHKRTSAGPS